MKIKIKALFTGATGLFLFAFLLPAQAALIGLEALPGSPVIVTSNAGITYDYTAGAGGGGVLTIEGLSGSVNQSILAPSGLGWTVGGAPVPATMTILNDLTLGLDTHYTLTALFDVNGVFQSGMVEITGVIDAVPTAFLGSPSIEYVDQFDPTLPGACFGVCGSNGMGAGGQNLLLKGNLLGFGFEGNQAGTHDALQIDFYMEVTGGDFATAGYASTGQRVDVGVIADGLVSYGTLSPGATGNYTGAWDTDAFKNDFVSCTGCGVQLQTFVPVPAAVWLFGSGLLGLIGTGIRNRRRNRLKA